MTVAPGETRQSMITFPPAGAFAVRAMSCGAPNCDSAVHPVMNTVLLFLSVLCARHDTLCDMSGPSAVTVTVPLSPPSTLPSMTSGTVQYLSVLQLLVIWAPLGVQQSASLWNAEAPPRAAMPRAAAGCGMAIAPSAAVRTETHETSFDMMIPSGLDASQVANNASRSFAAAPRSPLHRRGSVGGGSRVPEESIHDRRSRASRSMVCRRCRRRERAAAAPLHFAVRLLPAQDRRRGRR